MESRVPPRDDKASIIDDAGRSAFSEALTEALRTSGLPLSRIQARLEALGTPVTVATLSYWQSGRSLPLRKNSLRALGNIETIVGLPAGSLRDLLPRTRPTTTHILGRQYESSFLARALKELDLEHNPPAELMNIGLTVHVGPDRHIMWSRIHRTVRSHAAELQRLPIVLLSCTNPAPRVAEAQGFHIGREFRDNSIGVMIAEMVLDPAVGYGQLAHLDADIEWGRGGPEVCGYDWALPQSAHEFHLTVEFEGEAPERATAYGLAEVNPTDEELFRHDVPVTDGRVEMHLTDPGVGIFGLNWAE